MSGHSQDDYTAPVQLESLLEVPVKLILIEDLIREKSASLGLRNPESLTKEKEALSNKKCLFDCCATPSRWRNTDCFSNNSQFRTTGITLPWQESMAVIPVMQVGKDRGIMSSSNIDIRNINNDADRDIEMTNKNLNDDKEEQSLSPDSIPLSLTSKDNNKPEYANMPNLDEDEIPITVVEKPENLSTRPSNPEQREASIKRVSPASTSPTVDPPTTTALLGKVTEKPTRYEELITVETSSSPSSINTGNTITSPKNQQHNVQEDVTKDTTDAPTNLEQNNPVDDTLKLTFYNEGRKESTKEFRTTGSDSGGTSSGSSSDVRFFENQHGLQMSRVIREPGEVGPTEGNTRTTRQNQQSEAEESNESTSTENTQAQRKSPVSGSAEKNPPIAQSTSVITQQSQQLRLTSSIIQTLNSNNNNATTSNSANNSSNANNNTSTNTPSSTQQQQGRQWEGLQISRCQKEGASGITPDGESSSNSVSNREISSESSFTTTTTTPARKPPENEKGENENSIERHLQSYLTSLRYVKPTESANNERASSAGGQEGESSGSKSRSPIISPQSRQTASTNIISPVISPRHHNTGSPGAAGAGVISRMPAIQTVSPSQQASSLDSCPERTIARIPTRPFLRRNSTYFEQQQQQQQHQPPISAPRPPYHQNMLQQQQPRMLASSMPMTMSSTATTAEASTAMPLHSPPKRFKPTHLAGTNTMMAHQQQQQYHQQQQFHQQGYNAQNRYPSTTSNVSPHVSRNGNGHPTQIVQHHHQQQTPVTTASNLTRMSTIQHQQQSIQAYANLQHYNQQRPATQQQQHSGSTSTVSAVTSVPHHSPATANMYAAQQQHQQQQQTHHSYQMKYRQNASNLEAQHHQQQLQFHRHMQESLLMATTAVANSTEPVDSAYSDRLRRYCDFYNRQELDLDKLQEYYKKYGFYPWDILTVRDESILRQMRVQDQRNQQQQNQHQLLQQEVRQGQNANVARYDMVRRMEMEHVPAAQPLAHQSHQQQQAHHQASLRAMNVASSSGRTVSHYPQTSQQQPVIAHAASTIQVGMTGRAANVVSPPALSPQHSGTLQNRYPSNNHQLQRIQQQREYAAAQHHHQQQQQLNNRYYQTGQTANQNYRHPQHHQQMARAGQPSASLPTNYDIQNSPHFRNAYNQLATAAAAVSSVAAAAAVSQNVLRSAELRSGNTVVNPVRDERMAQHHLQPQCSGVGTRPVVMTVADPVPAPPEAVPLSIHRQALEQAIKNNQTVAKTAEIVHGNQGVTIYRRDQRASSPPSPSLARHQMPPQAHHGHSYPLGRPRSGEVIPGVPSTNKEPLRVVPSPTLAHQTSVIRRIQQQESPPSAAQRSSNHQYITERPGISYRRISNGSSTDSNGGGADTPVQTAFLYQQHKDSITLHAAGQYQQHQQHHHLLNEASGQQHAISLRRNIMANENNMQMLPRAGQKRRIIITDNNGINQNHSEARAVGVVSSPVPLIGGEEQMVTHVSQSALMANLRDELPDLDDRTDGGGGGASWPYDHVVLLDKRIKSYMCKRCFETLKTEQQIRNHLFCKMLANHVQCHVCLQLVTADTYPTHLQIHGVRPPDSIQIDN